MRTDEHKFQGTLNDFGKHSIVLDYSGMYKNWVKNMKKYEQHLITTKFTEEETNFAKINKLSEAYSVEQDSVEEIGLRRSSNVRRVQTAHTARKDYIEDGKKGAMMQNNSNLVIMDGEKSTLSHGN